MSATERDFRPGEPVTIFEREDGRRVKWDGEVEWRKGNKLCVFVDGLDDIDTIIFDLSRVEVF